MSDPNSWAPNTEQFELGDGEAHVWRAHLNCDEAVLHRLEATLTSDEKGPRELFPFPTRPKQLCSCRGSPARASCRLSSRLWKQPRWCWGATNPEAIA